MMAEEMEQAVLDQLKRIADAQEKNAAANAEFQRAIIAAFTPLIPAMLAMFSGAFSAKPPIMIPVTTPPERKTDG